MPKKYNADRAYATRQARLERENKLQIAVLNWLASDPENKFFLGVAIGSATSGIGTLLTGLAEDAGVGAISPEEAVGTQVKEAVTLGPYGYAFWKFNQMVGSTLAGTPTTAPQAVDTNNPGAAIGMMTTMLGGTFASWCAGMLMLRAIAGEDGINVGVLGSGVS